MSDWSVINAPLAPGLYIVATPLGHARDITLRALDVLAAANAIYCEDTRVSGKLMARYGIATPRLAYHEHNAQRMRPKILQRLAEGAALALISDAGTPLVSDPCLWCAPQGRRVIMFLPCRALRHRLRFVCCRSGDRQIQFCRFYRRKNRRGKPPCKNCQAPRHAGSV